MARSDSLRVEISMTALASFCTFVVLVSSTAANCETTLVFFHQFGEGSVVFGPERSLTAVSTNFGIGSVFDDAITISKEENSMELGRARGLYFYNSLEVSTKSNEQIFTVIFGANSEYQGSTLSFLGLWLSQGREAHELTVIGGTGAFRFSRGYATYETSGRGSYKVVAHLVSSDKITNY